MPVSGTQLGDPWDGGGTSSNGGTAKLGKVLVNLRSKVEFSAQVCCQPGTAQPFKVGTKHSPVLPSLVYSWSC